MRQAPTTKGYRPRVYQPIPQKFDKAERNTDNLIITPLYEEHLSKNPEITARPDIFQRVMGELTVPPRNRSRSFSASSAGLCLRRQELAFLGVKQQKTTDPRMIRIFQNGTFGHLRWQVGLLTAGILDDIEYTVQRGITRATLDGLGTAQRGVYRGLRFGWEHKGRMSFSFASQRRLGTPDAKTRKQVSMQMFLTGYEVWSVTNENKDTQEIDEFVIERNEEEIKDAKDELRELTRAVTRQKLHPMLPECIRKNTTGEYYKCPFGTDFGACVQSGTWPRAT